MSLQSINDNLFSPTPPPSRSGPPSTTESLPIIDLSAFLNPNSTSAQRVQTAFTINRACTDYGFFYLTGHGIPLSKLDQIISLARQFFFQPQEEKEKIRRHDAGPKGDGARGYQGMGENITLGRRDVQEAVDIYKEWTEVDARAKQDPPHKTLQGPNLWPENPPELKQVYLDYIAKLHHVSEALVRAMGHALSLGSPAETHVSDRTTEDEEIFVRNTQNSFWVMRMIGYPPLAQPASMTLSDDDLTEFSCGEHSDYGCVTLLLADPTPGALQVKLKNGKWLNADPVPGAFVVNIGDMIERWTNGLWASTRHRVIHRGNNYRVSVPFFYEPDWDAMVKPMDKCIEKTGGKPKFEGTTYGDHLLGKVFNNFYN